MPVTVAHAWALPAMRLTRLLHNDDAEVARRVVENALARLSGTAGAQRKRLYYGNSPKRSKTYYPAPALLHMLVFAESEPFERYEEQRCAVPADTLRIRYIKHLIWIAARRNSFHVALAICRLLFSYTTSDTMAIYDSILQETDFLKSDDYYRARKRILMSESERRFPALTRVQGPRAEERFAHDPGQEAHFELVLTALEACTPWGTRCGSDDDPELARLHLLIHPPCLAAIAARVGVAPPRERLALPHFEHVPIPTRSSAAPSERVPTAAD